MKKEDLSLKNLLECLLQIQADIRDTAEPCVIDKLDAVINDIQLLIERNESSSTASVQALKYLDKLLESLPSILKLIDYLSK